MDPNSPPSSPRPTTRAPKRPVSAAKRAATAKGEEYKPQEGKSTVTLDTIPKVNAEVAAKSALIARARAETLVLEWVEKLLDGVDEATLKMSARYLRPQDFSDAMLERKLEKLCGYPLCPQSLNPTSSTQSPRRSRNSMIINPVSKKGPIPEGFHSELCAIKASWFRRQLDDEPLYLRQLDKIPEGEGKWERGIELYEEMVAAQREKKEKEERGEVVEKSGERVREEFVREMVEGWAAGVPSLVGPLEIRETREVSEVREEAEGEQAGVGAIEGFRSEFERLKVNNEDDDNMDWQGSIWAKRLSFLLLLEPFRRAVIDQKQTDISAPRQPRNSQPSCTEINPSFYFHPISPHQLIILLRLLRGNLVAALTAERTLLLLVLGNGLNGDGDVVETHLLQQLLGVRVDLKTTSGGGVEGRDVRSVLV
ncbi:hypothetical protein G7K_1443-t1 [Saitoella complicata NRRL Y-17804]|uniref:RNA polymerase II subunit B1 CTD phosphatase RPAP2 homolog n=1 Tax=Saitoella complicata (strain BCRC 22490 / CBS 7301 / JCM 7358 / NBRC 10748 / NRRL Y-17804) TaxID=698492 RepID=A0A0E9NBQ1_SAICN|nr:hypothetical protein G7K_1443-t1 [Saitoella complicata NRRL Y-17804]